MIKSRFSNTEFEYPVTRDVMYGIVLVDVKTERAAFL